jgi:hypothetical protein
MRAWNFLFDALPRASVTLLKKIRQICFLAAQVAKECAASRRPKEMQVAVSIVSF